jgi:hypothetical protein
LAITVDSFLAALRINETGSAAGRYDAKPSGASTASGAYQYLDSTWNHYGGYAHAWQAPKAVQDARARSDVTSRLTAYNGDWAKVAAAHFAGGGWVQKHPDQSTWNQNPAPGSQNPTVSAYVNKLLKNAGSPKVVAAGNVPAATTSPTTGTTTTAAPSAQSTDSRPSDWIGTLDALLNPTFHQSSGFLDSINPFAQATNIAPALELVAARTGIALVGLVLFSAGLLLAIGPEVLGGLAGGIPGAAAVAGTVINEHKAKAAANAGEHPAEEKKAA